MCHTTCFDIDAGGVDVILRAIRQHGEHDRGVLIKALWALKNLSHTESGTSAVLNTGGHVVIISQLVDHIHELEVMHQGVGGLLNIMHQGGLTQVQHAWDASRVVNTKDVRQAARLGGGDSALMEAVGQFETFLSGVEAI